MRPRSTSDQDGDSLIHPFAANLASGRPRSPGHKVAPRLSLPQRPLVVDATPAEEWGEAAPLARKSKRVKKPPTQALAVHSAETGPLDLPEPVSPADLHLIPRAFSAIKSVRSTRRWLYTSSPRIAIIKLSLICLAVVSVLCGTFATAGGGKVTNLLFSTFESVVLHAPGAQPAGPTTVAQRVQPITQADLNAGYDSPQQHDTWWNSACSAAAMTEILHAWGVKEVTIGQIIDLLSAHSPPYITPWGGLMDQAGWPWLAQAYQLQAQVQWHAYTFETLVRQVTSSGIPIIIGIQGATGWAHFLIVVGGNSQEARVVDSSLWHIHSVPRSSFSDYTSIGIDSSILWTGETVLITPG